MAEAGTSPPAESVAPLIDRARSFRTDVEALVLQETKDWVTEFQNSMVQMEKDIVAQVAALKAQVDKATQAKEAAEQPGSIQLQISKCLQGRYRDYDLRVPDRRPRQNHTRDCFWAVMGKTQPVARTVQDQN
jgi:hypothetical protein